MPGQVSSTALVRYCLADYSTPEVHAHKKVTIKGYVDRVEIALGAGIVARARRFCIRGDVVCGPLHRLLEARFEPRGKWEYIRVQRPLEDFPENAVTAAVQDAVKRNLVGTATLSRSPCLAEKTSMH